MPDPAAPPADTPGRIRALYGTGGWQNSRPNPASTAIAGYPVEDEVRVDLITRTQRFQGGRIYSGEDAVCWYRATAAGPIECY